jgi:hypothetical protein
MPLPHAPMDFREQRDPGVEVDESIHEVEEVHGRQPGRELLLGSKVTTIGTFSSPSLLPFGCKTSELIWAQG